MRRFGLLLPLGFVVACGGDGTGDVSTTVGVADDVASFTVLGANTDPYPTSLTEGTVTLKFVNLFSPDLEDEAPLLNGNTVFDFVAANTLDLGTTAVLAADYTEVHVGLVDDGGVSFHAVGVMEFIEDNVQVNFSVDYILPEELEVEVVQALTVEDGGAADLTVNFSPANILSGIDYDGLRLLAGAGDIAINADTAAADPTGAVQAALDVITANVSADGTAFVAAQ